MNFRLFSLFSFLFPLTLSAQFTLSMIGDSLRVDDLGSDVEFYMNVQNNSSGGLELRWRIMESDFPAGWEDFTCDYICYTPETRALDLNIGDSVDNLPIIHHIGVHDIAGIGASKFCVFDRSDSAGTIQCLRVKASTSAYLFYDSLLVDDSDLIVVLGVVYEKSNGSYTEYLNSSQFSIEDIEFIVIDGALYEFKNDRFRLYKKVTNVTIGGTDYIIVNGKAYTTNGATFTFYADLEEFDLDGKTVYILGSDTFELIGDLYFPLAVTEIAIEHSILNQNSPNPFSVNSFIECNSGHEDGLLVIQDLTGRIVKQIDLREGFNRIEITANELGVGMFFYSYYNSSSGLIESKRMSVIKR
jgi:hypothetical protein